MDANLVWSNDEQGAIIVPHLAANQPGPDDRRIWRGIMHVLKAECRWRDGPKEYGPHKTIYNRFSRWSEKGVWQKLSSPWPVLPSHPNKPHWIVAM